MSTMKYVGVDGCPYGWFSVAFGDKGNYETKKWKTFAELLKHYKKADLILVDIPIGLPEGPAGRECDRKAKEKIKPRGSTVFPTPTRRTVEQAAEAWLIGPKDGQPFKEWQKEQHRIAAKIEKETSCRGLSIQSFSIAPKIAEVDKALRVRDTNSNLKIREVHPELCFWALNGEKPVRSGKKKPHGLSDRRRVLSRRTCLRADEVYQSARDTSLRKDVARDDILDALVAAVTAYHGSRLNQLEALPEEPPKDCTGLRIEMVYWIPR